MPPLPAAPRRRADTVRDAAAEATIDTSTQAVTTAHAPVQAQPAPAKRSAKASSVVSAAAAATQTPQVSPVPKPRTAQKAKKAQVEALAPVAVPAASTVAAPKAKAAKTAKVSTAQSTTTKASAGRAPHLFVLDTNVLLHDPMSLFRFQEHDIFLPLIVLEELDAHKKGPTEVARNARQVSRTLDELVQSAAPKDGPPDLAAGLELNTTGHKTATGRLFLQTTQLDHELPASLPRTRADNGILATVFALRAQEAASAGSRRAVALVSKDINMRVKASALGLVAEDYRNDKVLDDGDVLYTGALTLPEDFWDRAHDVKSWTEGTRSYYSLRGDITQALHINQFVHFDAAGHTPLHARVSAIEGDGVQLQTLRDFTSPRLRVWGINARNKEQNFALNMLMDPSIDFVSITGTAGTGKTLLALAAGLAQVLDERIYSEIIMTRATVNVGEDIGFLPGTEEEKMGPWMGALDDNLEFLAKGEGGNPSEWGRSATNDLIRSRIKIKSLNFMRGRTFLNKFLIIDEAQNLTPKQMKTLITRAGPGTKIVCMGNLAQIDTPYLSEGSSGLTYAVDRFKGWPHGAHIQLARGERSRLADFASEVL